MAPFGVRVHSVITGGVDTAICDGNIKTSLGDSFYDVDGVYESIRSSAMMSRDLNISPEQYAKEVVRDIVSWRDPGFNLYHGARSYFCIGLVVSCHWLVEFGVQVHFKQRRVLQTIAKLIKVKNHRKRSMYNY